jgi:3-deoxy-D-manno-octulosonate 8-phosphate phosphatase (KDO 8-P phosphatase)
VKLAAFDVDGVFTDGRFSLDGEGRDSVSFHVRDGMAVKLLLAAGIEVALISGRDSRAGRIRAERLGIRNARFAVPDKAAELRKILETERVEPEATLFVGDDLSDLPAFSVAGLAGTVADGAPEVVARADFVTTARGGEGAVREVAELLLKACGRWAEVVARFAGQGR